MQVHYSAAEATGQDLTRYGLALRHPPAQLVDPALRRHRSRHPRWGAEVEFTRTVRN